MANDTKESDAETSFEVKLGKESYLVYYKSSINYLQWGLSMQSY